MIPPENQETSTHDESNKKRKRQPRKDNGVKVPRKENFMKKILKNDKATKESSFLKRKPTLIAKARQLQQFCGVSVGLVIQSPDGIVDTWPENRSELENLIALYKGLDKRRKKEVKLLDFLENKKRKLENKKNKVVKGKVDQLGADLSGWINGLSGDSLVESVNFLSKKVVDLKEKIKLLEAVERKGKQVIVDFGNQTSLSYLGTNNFLSRENFGSCSNNFSMGNKMENNNFLAQYKDAGSFGFDGDKNNFLPINGAIDNSFSFEQQLGNRGGPDQAHQNNFGLKVEKEMSNNIMLLPNPGNVHVSAPDEGLSGSIWSPWF